MKKIGRSLANKYYDARAALREWREPGPAEVSESLGMPYLQIPVNGDPTHWDSDKEQEVPYKWNPKWGARVIDPENAPTPTQLLAFLEETPGAYDRLIYCPQINNDHTDGWGMFGYSRGFIFVNGVRYAENHTLSDIHFMDNIDAPSTPSGRRLPTISHYDFFPRNKLYTQEITERTAPEAFAFLVQLYETPPQEQTTLPGAPQTAIGSAILGLENPQI